MKSILKDNFGQQQNTLHKSIYKTKITLINRSTYIKVRKRKSNLSHGDELNIGCHCSLVGVSGGASF
jgi:hypothetical protein